MLQLKADVLVLGAGMVGVSAALHLQQRGRDVVLLDRHERAGEETSHGNAGLIECASVFPYMFPRELAQILRYALNREPHMRYRVGDLPAFLPWLARYFRASSPERALRSAMAELPLIQRSLVEHEALIAAAGVPELLRRTGWIKLFRHEASLAAAVREMERAKAYGVEGALLDAPAIAAREPCLTGEFAGALHWPAPGFVPDPGGLAKAYAALFQRRGGRFLSGDARTLEHDARGWAVKGRDGAVRAREAVVALGPWSDLVSLRLAIRSRSRSSAAIISIWRRAAMPCSTIPCSIPILVICWHRWTAAFASPPASNLPGAMRRRHRSSCNGHCRGRMRCFRWASPSRASPGWARGRACPI